MLDRCYTYSVATVTTEARLVGLCADDSLTMTPRCGGVNNSGDKESRHHHGAEPWQHKPTNANCESVRDVAEWRAGRVLHSKLFWRMRACMWE